MISTATTCFVDDRGSLRTPNGTREEARLILDWENGSRATSFDTEPIEESTHWAWYETMRQTVDDLLLVVHDGDGQPIGTVRFRSGERGDARIGVIIAPTRRAAGWGRWAIASGCRAAFQARSYRRILAEIKLDNRASLAAFRAAGFVAAPHEPPSAGDGDVVVMEYRRDWMSGEEGR